jgi:hypothetical protein
MKKINFSLYRTRWFGLWKKELRHMSYVRSLSILGCKTPSCYGRNLALYKVHWLFMNHFIPRLNHRTHHELVTHH